MNKETEKAREKVRIKFAVMVLYEMYKTDWIRQLPLRSILNELTTYYEEYKEDPTESCGIDEHIFENGYGGSIYVCFEEFCGAELRDEEYIRYLTNGNEELMSAARKYVADNF